MATCTDTLARASEARSKQGTHELEISFGGELDLHKHFQNCTKNPKHLNFIPINSLDMHHLPEVLRITNTFSWIKYIAERTVKLSVRYVSSHRQPPLPLSDYAGQDILTVGSGFMSDICLVEGKHEMPCPFDNCSEQPGQHQVYGYIIITTAAHVVFDDDEAKNTTVEFFYDNPNDKSNIRTARGVKVGAVSVEGDFCEMLCVTHDILPFDWKRKAFLEIPKDVSETVLFTNDVRINCSLFRGYIRTPTFSVECRKNDDIACPLKECLYLSESHNVYGYIIIMIEANVMWDYEKVKSATIEFFYMDPEDNSNIHTARAEVVNAVSVDEVVCELQCVTHDKQLFDFLTQENYKQNVRLFRDEESISCDLMRRFPCIEHVYVSEIYLKSLAQLLFVDISLDNVSDCAELLVLLLTYNFDIIVNALQNTYSNKNMFSVKQKTNVEKIDADHFVINGQLELNTSLLRKKDISIYDSNLVKYQDIILQLKTLLMEVPVNIGCLYKFLTESVKETENNIFITQTVNMLHVTCMKSDEFDNICHEYLQRSNIDNVVDENLQRSNIDDVLDENLQRSNIDDVVDENLPRSNIDDVLDENLQRSNFANIFHENLQRSNMDDVLDESLQRSNIKDRYNEHDTSHNKLVVHISHPHGQSKQISFGTLADCFTGDGHYKPLYTVPTCPGCSGGPVWMMSAAEELINIYGVPHGGCLDNQLNHGCSWTIYPPNTITLPTFIYNQRLYPPNV